MSRPRTTLEIDLARLEEIERGDFGASVEAEPAGVGSRVWRDEDLGLGRVGSWGGAALALARLVQLDREERASPDPRRVPGPLLFAVGDAVRRGLPTAARISLIGRSPSTGFLIEGQVGGALGLHIGSIADGIVLRGMTSLPGALLRIARDGSARLEAHPELRGLSSVDTWESLAPAENEAMLSIGPGGEGGLPFATLAAVSSASSKPSFVGRGGLGALFGALGLKAVVVAGGTGPAAREEEALNAEAADRLRSALVRSPRLAARARGGTLELFDAYAARGELEGEREGARRIADQARDAQAGREGCPKCPTPCGWIFEGADGRGQGVRFGAGRALSVNLRIPDFSGALRLLGVCDAQGIDAKEAGAMLALLARARETGRIGGEALWGDAAAFERVLRTCLDPENRAGHAVAFRAGAGALARFLGLEEEIALVRGTPVRRGANLAALLGQCVSTGGTDPMRSFPFLVGDRSREDLERLAADLGPLPEGTEDASLPAGKGRLVAWHEELVTGVDATGFCAFSTAGLLADGVASLEELARWILPEELLEPEAEDWRAAGLGVRLLAMGANLVLLRRLLDAQGRTQAGDPDRPEWAAAQLDLGGMLGEYRELRGLDGSGRPDPVGCGELGSVVAGRRAGVLEGKPPTGTSTIRPRPEPRRVAESPQTGSPVSSVCLRTSGMLRDAIGASSSLPIPGPRSVEQVLRLLADAQPGAARGLFQDDRPIPAVWREGRHLAMADTVRPGDVLDLVTAIAGG